MNEIRIALWTYLTPMASTRAFKIGLFAGFITLGLVVLSVVIRPVSDQLSRFSLNRLQEMILVPGVALTSVLLSELPLRDGIRHRTLLYLLLGPVSRPMLAAVRTVVTAALLAVAGGVLLVATRIASGSGMEGIIGDLLAISLGGFAYIGLFGMVHLFTGRGLIANLVLFGVFDDPLSRIPFGLRNLSLSYHVRTLADQVSEIPLPVTVAPPEPSMGFSVFALLMTGVVTTATSAILFRRKNLGELC